MPSFTSFDGVQIAYRLHGAGRPTLLLHGLMIDAETNWFAPGLAQALAATGRLVIAPDLRGHGASAAPEDPAAYPPDVLAIDQAALLAHLGVEDYDLVGYSLGARMALRMLVRGARPGKTVLGGLGDSGVIDLVPRRTMFEDAVRRGQAAADPETGRRVQATLAVRGLKPAAILGVLGQQIDTDPADLTRLDAPILVVSGRHDEDNGSAEGLGALLPGAVVLRTPGSHMSAIGKPELADAILRFLNG